jgi:hypothetical protein
MKKFLSVISVLSLILFFGGTPLSAQDTKKEKENKKEASVRSLINAQQYTFEAQMAIPIGMRSRQLTSTYELKVTKDTVDCYLPYFGKAYRAPIGSSEGGIQFKTTDFKYTLSQRKNGGWDITITPKSAGDTRQMTLYISSTGYSTLQVNSNNRQPISFNGYIK